MKRTALMILLVLFPYTAGFVFSQQVPGSESNRKMIRVEIKKNIEFVGFILHMGWLGPEIEAAGEIREIEGRQIPETEWRAYGYHVYQNYKKYTQSPHLAKIVEIGSNLDYDPVIFLMMIVDDLPRAHLCDNVPDEVLAWFSPDQNVKTGREIARVLLEAMNSFYFEVDFDDYLKEAKRYYDIVLDQVIKAKMEDGFIDSMEAFYRQKFKSYTLIPGLLIPTGMGFGPRIATGKNMEIYNIFGPLDVQVLQGDRPDLGFTDKRRLMELSVHEFGHSFVNPVIDMVPDSLLKATEYLFDEIKNEMTDQGYPKWETCLNEHFVRAGEVLILQSMGLDKNAEDLRTWYLTGRHFIYLPEIIEELNKYKDNKYPGYRDTVIAALERLKAIPRHTGL